MPISTLFWLAWLLYLVYAGWRGWGPTGDRWYSLGAVFVLALFAILGWHEFGSVVK